MTTQLKYPKKNPHSIWISESDEGQSDAINKDFKIAPKSFCAGFLSPGQRIRIGEECVNIFDLISDFL